MMGEELMGKEMALYHLAQFLMQAEIGTVCFTISAFSKKNLMGAGLGIAIIMFAADMMCRIIPAIENVKYVTPFYYSNGADIFTSGEINGVILAIGLGIMGVTFVAAFMQYERKDLAA